MTWKLPSTTPRVCILLTIKSTSISLFSSSCVYMVLAGVKIMISPFLYHHHLQMKADLMYVTESLSLRVGDIEFPRIVAVSVAARKRRMTRIDAVTSKAIISFWDRIMSARFLRESIPAETMFHTNQSNTVTIIVMRPNMMITYILVGNIGDATALDE